MGRSLVSFAAAILLIAVGAAPAFAEEKPANGTVTITTGPGVLPAWTSADIAIVGISPGSVTTSRFSTSATITLPIVAKTGTANATAGGFRILNTSDGTSFSCRIPTVDTRARVVDCVTDSGYNTALFVITDIGNRERFNSATTATTIFQDMEMRLSAIGASVLNARLDTSVFSTSVRSATGELIVSRDR